MKTPRTVTLFAVLGALVFAGAVFSRALAADEEGVALVIVYDTSGSMNNSVRDGTGQLAPKRVIAKRALEAVVKRLQTFVTGAAPAAPRTLQAGLLVFNGDRVREAIPLDTFDARNVSSWTQSIPVPTSGTPLGLALETAGKTILKSHLARKHILVITDGINTVGPDPARVLPGIQEQAGQRHAKLSVHFIAFDVDAKVFDPLKKLGVTVVGAANEMQLNTQLGFILEKKILLEDEEPPQKNRKN